MKFQAKTENEIIEAGLLPKGEYDFEVIKAEKAVGGPQSKNPGVEYIKLNVQVFMDDRTRFVNGVLHPKMEAQLRHFCVVGKLMDKYDAGTLDAEDCVGVAGRLKLRVKDADGNFPAKNEIQDFIVPKEKPVEASPSTPNTGDDVPF